jgi:hypothetical protein
VIVVREVRVDSTYSEFRDWDGNCYGCRRKRSRKLPIDDDNQV